MALSKLEDVIFSINTGETITDTNQVTDFPVEDRNNIVDNIDPDPRIISFSGIVVGEDAERKLNTLRGYQRNGNILTYTGRNIFSNVVIESLSTVHDNTIKSGFKFEISLKEIQTAEIQTTLIDFSIVPRPSIQRETKQGRKQLEMPPPREAPDTSSIIDVTESTANNLFRFRDPLGLIGN